MDGFSWTQVAGLMLIGGFLIALLRLADAWSRRVSSGESAKEIASAALAKAEAAEANLAAFKAEVAKDYASNAMILQLETRLVAAIDRIGDRLDRAFERHGADQG